MEEPDRDSNDAPLYDGDARGSDSRNGGWPAPRFLNMRISLGTPSKIEESRAIRVKQPQHRLSCSTSASVGLDRPECIAQRLPDTCQQERAKGS